MSYVERYVFTRDGKDFCLIIEPDPDADNPRDWDPMGHMLCWHNRYTLGDDNPYGTPGEFLEDIASIPDEDIVLIQMDMLDHSGLSIYAAGTKPYDDPWDSGQIGWIYATRDDAARHGCKWEDVEARLLGEIEMYAKYVAGDCVMGTVCELDEDYDPDNIEAYLGDTRDTCGGIYTNETWGQGLAEEVLETMGYGDYSTLTDV